jgi:inhibitor of KinA sporulation pathway (predicted exonuclease)
MNKNYYAFYDFESTHYIAERAQPTEIAAIMIDPVRLEIVPNSLFQSLIKPSFDKEYCAEYNLEPPTDKVLALTHKTRNELENAPHVSTVFAQFVDYLHQYKTSNSQWGRPIRVGYNIHNYDDIIIRNLCSKEPYKLGYWNDDTCKDKIWHPIDSYDLMEIVGMFIEGRADMRSKSFDNIRRWLGLESDKAHTAEVDVIQGAIVFCRFMKLIRTTSKKTKFENALANFNVKDYMNET